jgi:hypothetical protein
LERSGNSDTLRKNSRKKIKRPPPTTTGPPKLPEYRIDYSTSEFSGADKSLYVDPEYVEQSSA